VIGSINLQNGTLPLKACPFVPPKHTTRNDKLTATFADDTDKLSSDANPSRASDWQHHLSLSQNWLKYGKSR
jgi:hypothetical protein